jgi:hypothetical protein
VDALAIHHAKQTASWPVSKRAATRAAGDDKLVATPVDVHATGVFGRGFESPRLHLSFRARVCSGLSVALLLPLTLYGGPNLTDNGVKMVPSTSQYGENATDSHSREGTRRILSTECALSLGWISSRQFVKPRCRSMSAKMRATSPSSITSRLRAAASNKTCVQTWLTTRGRPRLAAKTRLSALSANTGRSV